MADTLPISGNIDPKTFPFLLMDLHQQGATGSLKVEGPTYQKALYFRGGRVLFGSSNDPRDQLGAILIEAGKITPEQLEDVNAKVGPGNPLAKVLADTGFVNQRELSEAARAKVERILSDVIAYTSGSFEFEDGVLPKGAIDLKLSTEKVLLAAVRRISDRAFVLRHIENLEVVLSVRRDKASALGEIQAETGGLVDQLDGRQTLKEAAGRTRLDEFEAAKVACALLFLGLASRAGEQPTIAAPVGDEAELDLGATASAAFAAESEPTFFLSGSAPGVGTAAPEPSPFFVPDAEPEPEAEPPIPPPEPVPPAPSPPAAGPVPEAVPSAPPPIVIPEPEPVPAVMMMPPMPIIPEPEPTVPSEPTVVMAAPKPPPTSGPALVYPPNAPSRPRPEPTRPSPSRPSKDDLAALDVLLNPKAHEGPLAPLQASPREEAWAPQLGRGRGRARRGLPSFVTLGVGALLLIAAAAAGLWYYRQDSSAFSFARGGTKASPIPRSPAPPTTLAAATSPAAGTAAALPPTAAPITTTPAAAPTPRATTAVPTPVATPPVATRPLATPLPTAAPVANTLDQARTALQRGSYAEAARAFAAHLRRAPAGTATVQLLVACSADTVQKATTEVGSGELFIVPVNYKGRDCFRMCWGLYPDASRAASASRSLPEYFRRGGASPRVVTATEILP